MLGVQVLLKYRKVTGCCLRISRTMCMLLLMHFTFFRSAMSCQKPVRLRPSEAVGSRVMAYCISVLELDTQALNEDMVLLNAAT